MIVITDVSNEPPIRGDLFAGLQFWISQRCPNRIDLVKRVKYNGGEVVLNEKLARYLIADHERDGLPSGSISYRFILDSVDNQQLEDVENHRCGPPVGSARTTASAHPPRHGRVPFSAQDDIDLYRYVSSCKRKKCHVNGNEIYKDFARQNPRHSYQSWRDRYVKHLSVKPPLGASRLTPSPEPRPLESYTNENDQKVLSETSTKPSDTSPAGASRPNPSLGPRPSESPANIDREKTATGTLTESSDTRPVEVPRSTASLEPQSRPSELPTNTNGKKAATRTSTELSDKPPMEASRPTPPSEPRPSASPAGTTSQNVTAFNSKRSSNSAPLKKLSFGGSPSAIDELCPDLPAVIDQFHIGNFDELTGAGYVIEGCVEDNNESWVRLARSRGDHTAEQWRTFWVDCVRPVYQQVGEDLTKARIYDQAQEEWKAKTGADASVRGWVSYFRKEIAPRLRELQTTPSQEPKNSTAREQQQGNSKGNGDAHDSDPDKSARSPSPRRKHGNGSWNVDGHHSSPVQSSLRKRQRETDSDAENGNETPPAKRPQLDIPEDESEDKIHDSIEFSPTKKLASSPLGERKVIQIGSGRSSSSSSDLFVRSSSKDKCPEVQGSPEAEQAQDESQENGDVQIFDGWQGQVRGTLWGLDDQKILELLELLRTAPSDLEEPDDMLPFDAAVMRTVHVLSNNDQSAAHWRAFQGVLSQKLEEFGIFGQLFEDDESDESEDENQAEEQNDQEEEQNENQEKHSEHQEDQYQRQDDQYEHQEQFAPYDEQYEAQDEQYGQHDEQSALENGATSGEIDCEPTIVPESSLREATPQINYSNDSTFTFVDSNTQIDGDNPSDYPIDLTSEAEAQAYITSRLSPPWAFSEVEILIALHATCSNSAALADRVLRWMRQNDPTKGKGKGKERSRGRRSSIGPSDKFLPVMAGVWTGDDDEAILGMAGLEDEQRIVRKHGAARCKQRRAFLMSFE